MARLSSSAFLAAPGNLRGQQAAAGAMVAAAPLPAAAAELTFDQFGPTEQVAIFLPLTFVILAYAEWTSKQPDCEDVTGDAYLGKTVDGDANNPNRYFRRSPEYD